MGRDKISIWGIIIFDFIRLIFSCYNNVYLDKEVVIIYDFFLMIVVLNNVIIKIFLCLESIFRFKLKFCKNFKY